MTENNLYPDAQSPAPKKSRKTPIIIAVAAVVVIAAILIAVFAGGAGSSPLALVAKGADNTMDALLENQTVTLLNDLITHGSMDITADLAPITESALGYAMDGQAKISMYCSNKESLALTADVTLGVTPLLDAVMVMSPQDIAVGSQSLLGDAVYGVDLETLPQHFDSSVFGPNGAYSLGMTAEEVMQIVDNLKSGEELSAEAEKVIKDFVTATAASVLKNSTVSEEKSSLAFAGESCKTTAVTVTMTAENLCAIAEDVLNYLNTNKELETFLQERAAAAPEAAEVIDEFYDEIAAAVADLNETKAEIMEANPVVNFTFHITEEGTYLVATLMDITSTEGDISIEYLIGPDPGSPREISFLTNIYGYEDGITYTVTVNDKDSYSAKLTTLLEGEAFLTGTLNWNRATGTLLAEVSADGETYSCAGTFTHSDKAEVFTVISVSDGYEDIPLGVTVTLNRSAQFPELPAYTDLLTMSEAEIDNLLDDLSAAALGLLFAMG